MSNIEADVLEQIKQGNNDDDVINDEEDLATGFRDSAAAVAAVNEAPQEVVYSADLMRNMMSKGEESSILQML